MTTFWHQALFEKGAGTASAPGFSVRFMGAGDEAVPAPDVRFFECGHLASCFSIRLFPIAR
jgi:hypothetical protein